MLFISISISIAIAIMNLRVDIHDLGEGGGLVPAHPLLTHPDRVVSPPASQAWVKGLKAKLRRQSRHFLLTLEIESLAGSKNCS